MGVVTLRGPRFARAPQGDDESQSFWAGPGLNRRAFISLAGAAAVPLAARPAATYIAQEQQMATPVVLSQFTVGKNKIVHKPTQATFSFDTGDTVFKSVDWPGSGKQRSSVSDYRKDDVMRVAQQLLSKLPR
jgi:ABC-type sulfate transport system substrate-binding protein